MAPSTPAALSLISLALALSACPAPPVEDKKDAGVDDSDAGSDFVEAPHPLLPQVVSLGGSVIPHPTVVPIFYTGDPSEADVVTFLPELNNSSFWSDTTLEYGITALTVGDAIHFSGSAPQTLTAAQLQTNFADGFANGLPGWGTPDQSTIYLVVIPEATTFNDQDDCCAAFDGEHFESDVGGTAVAMAVTCRCPGIDGPDIGEPDQLTIAISHELIESATDPFNNPAFVETDDADYGWTLLTEGEVSDMCEYLDSIAIKLPGIDDKVQRSWSNKAAAANLNPCVPAPAGEVYFNSVPVLPDTVSIDDGFGDTISAKGIKIAQGQSGTVDVQLFSVAPTSGKWTVTAYDGNELGFGGNPDLSFVWDKTTGQNGDTLKLTITVDTADAQIRGETFLIDSVLGNQSNITIGLVGQQ